MENGETYRSKGELIVLNPRRSVSTGIASMNPGIIVQLLSIRDNHPQWRELTREDNVVAAHKYAAQLKSFNAPHEIVKL